MDDLQKVYTELQDRQMELNSFYELIDGKHELAQTLVDAFLGLLKIPKNDDSVMAALTRIVSLREDALEQVLQKMDFSKDEIIAKKELAYGFTTTLHLRRHESFIEWLESKKLLSPFYRGLIFGMHTVGVKLSQWQSSWTAHIINGVNAELSQRFDGNDKDVLEYLAKSNLLDRDSNGDISDRCYSALVNDGSGTYTALPYALAFPNEVAEVVSALDYLLSIVSAFEDEVYSKHKEWTAYFQAIKDAFSFTSIDGLVEKWANVDRAWMSIDTPIQVGHPLEYYEDHYRKAVALEWDLRIINPTLQNGSNTSDNIKAFASNLAEQFGSKATSTIDKNLTQVDETQLYIGQPILYYGAELNGLFSAQVVPNDEQVSAELGKKIFAYADFVMESKKSKPIMKLSVETMGEKFVTKQRKLIEENPRLWQEIYDISTIGHEFGHILWIDSDTETGMNGTGVFKNIEEFKATAGGLMAFFHDDKESNEALKHHIIDDLVSRAVGLMAWREVGEVLPYYCEGLIHLKILFDSGVISYNKQIDIDYSRYEEMKSAYKQAYQTLAQTYLDKIDAQTYLDNYTQKRGAVYLPNDKNILSFVEHYYKRYQEIGQQTVKLSQ